MNQRKSEKHFAVNEFGVIIVNWNTKHELKECIESFLAEGVRHLDIMVVDQGSGDGSVELLRRDFRGVQFLHGDNTGYGVAINRAVRKLLQKFLIFANADTIVLRGCLSEFLSVFQEEPRAALLGPAILDDSGKSATRFSKTSVSRAILLELVPATLRGRWRDFEQVLYSKEKPFPVRYVEGAFMAVQRSAFIEEGGFDEGFSFFFEDADLPVRMLRSGRRVLHVPGARIIHRGSRSFSQVPEIHTKEFYRNLILLYERHAYRRAVWLRRALRTIVGMKAILFSFTRLVHREHEKAHNLCKVKAQALQKRTALVLSHPAEPFVSIIIPTFERESVFDVLEGLKRQSYPHYEVLVVDQSKVSPGKWKRRGLDRKRLRIITSETRGRSAAKNTGIFHASGDILLFLDDDILPPPNLVESHVNMLRTDSVGGVSFRHTEKGLVPTTTTNICRVTSYGRVIDRYHSDVTTYVGTLTGPNMSMTRFVQQSAGFFETGLTGTSILEEPDFSERIRRGGLKLLFSNMISFRHLPQPAGNRAQQQSDPTQYYHDFHYNEIFFFLKNRHRGLIPVVVLFCLLRSLKQSLIHHRFGGDAWHMFSGVFAGTRAYYRFL